MNLSKQLPIQVQKVEAAKQRIGNIWLHQTHRNKIIFGVSAVVTAGLVIAVGQKYASSSITHLRRLVSTLALISRLVILPLQENQAENNKS